MTFHRAQTTLQKSLNKASNSGNISKTKMERHEKKKKKSEQNKHNIFKSFSKVIHAWGEKELEILQLEAAFPSWAGEARLRSACLPHPLSFSFYFVIIFSHYYHCYYSIFEGTKYKFSFFFFFLRFQWETKRAKPKWKQTKELQWLDWLGDGWLAICHWANQFFQFNSIGCCSKSKVNQTHKKLFCSPSLSLFSRPPINSDGSETKRKSGGGNTKSTSKNFINFFGQTFR